MREQNSATTMNRRAMLKLSAAAALFGPFTIPDKIQAIANRRHETHIFARTATEAAGGCRGEAFSRLCADRGSQ
jgi:hypothetical protein